MFVVMHRIYDPRYRNIIYASSIKFDTEKNARLWAFKWRNEIEFIEIKKVS